MSSKAPPVPPENANQKGPAQPQTTSTDDTQKGQVRTQNLAEQGRQGNIKQNTTNQGYQQDR
ncbi:hypothetical protein GCM10007276_08420 [Agaricicola taiwanensis]|uniref:Uncharacterized protein n=1 Tax=Agaricicola taiwanensis TaxID=591372 RepID=A0A8J2VJW8_9RHOB|nr:hypothetical protein [Agaricicola taiwanensis]GGE33460.1 hypothetical protein GCM10007276_08420 [Agaricicola taiwanensis]